VKYSNDCLATHERIVREDVRSTKASLHAAQMIERSIARQGWSEGGVFGSEPTLRARFHCGHRVLRQAIRILESRHVCRMRKGPGGGLVITRPSRDEAIDAVADYLQISGVADAELVEALLALDWMTAAGSSNSAPDQPPLPAAADPVSDARAGSAAHRTPNAAIGLFASAFAEVRRRLAGEVDGVAETPPLRSYGADTVNRAADLAARLAGDIALLRKSGPRVRLGTEDELCHRYVVGHAVLRQAVCILETYGLIATRRGRGGGIEARIPHPRGAMEMTLSYISSNAHNRAELLTTCALLFDVTAVLAGARWSDDDQRWLDRSVAGTVDFLKDGAEMLYYRAEWKATRNRALEFMVRTLAAYHNRFLPDVYYAAGNAVDQLRDTFEERIRAIARNDIAAAQSAMQRRSQLLREWMRRSRETAPAAT
jgi:DNA-binding FadR family transcriptional regulator